MAQEDTCSAGDFTKHTSDVAWRRFKQSPTMLESLAVPQDQAFDPGSEVKPTDPLLNRQHRSANNKMSYLANQCRCNYFIDILNSFRDTYRGQAEASERDKASMQSTDQPLDPGGRKNISNSHLWPSGALVPHSSCCAPHAPDC